MIRVFNKFEPIPEGFVEIDTTSRGPYKDLSPFYLGPVMWNDPITGPQTCQRFENLWQYSKVYPQHATPTMNSDLPMTYDPLLSHYEWRQDGFSKHRAERYPMGKGVKPLYTLWKGTKYSYIEAREVLYIPVYSTLVLETKSYAMLYNMVLHGDNIALRDFDGYDHINRGMTFEQVVMNPKKSLGHAFIIYGLLTGDLARFQGQRSMEW
jgi:hypothetical protein